MKKSVWGPLYWYTLHCLVIHIQDEYFESERNNIINTINSIITNLPCPTCKQHAMAMFKRRKLNKIMNKDDLINELYLMHEEVNKRLNKKSFTYDEHIALYQRMSPLKIFKMFIDMNVKDKISINMLTSKFHLKIFCESFRKYMMSNSYKFIQSST
jgi:hypothetical protein